MKEQMDSIVREGFDSHINLVWSTSQDPVVEYRLVNTSSQRRFSPLGRVAGAYFRRKIASSNLPGSRELHIFLIQRNFLASSSPPKDIRAR
jgi:hypothetical protein